MAKNNVGKVVQIIGPTVDVAFDSEHLPRILNAIKIEDPARDRCIAPHAEATLSTQTDHQTRRRF